MRREFDICSGNREWFPLFQEAAVVDMAERQGGWFGREPGVVQPKLAWSTQQINGLLEVSGKIIEDR